MRRLVARYLRRHGLPLVALFVALGGTSYAATGFPANVIGAKQLKRNAVTNPKIANGAVTGAKLAKSSITGAHVRESSLGQVSSAAHAVSATSASRATNAATAPNATNAANATNAINAANAFDAVTATTAAGAGRFAGALATAYQRRVTGQCEGARTLQEISSSGAPGCSFSAVKAFSVDIENGAYSHRQGPLSLVFFCNTSNTATFSVWNVGDSVATLNWFYGDGTNVYASGASIGRTDPPSNLAFDFGERIEGQFIFASGSQVLTVSLHAQDANVPGCHVRLTVKQALAA